MLKLRLARVGKKNQAFFRLIISDHTKSPKAEAMEILGSYNPRLPKDGFQFKADRVKYWLAQGVGYSDTVGDFLAKAGLIKKGVIKYTSSHPKKSKKQLEKDKAAAEEKAKAGKAGPGAAGEAAPAPSQTEKPKAEVKPTEKPVEKTAAKPEVKKEDKKEAPQKPATPAAKQAEIKK
jgi:small subunit ribosomal protein S16